MQELERLFSFDPNPEMVKFAETGTDRIELYTEAYAKITKPQRSSHKTLLRNQL